nr:glycine--tRNA ligase [Candidatus Nanosynbacter sp. TM7-008]MCJ1964373.1 glycine--tRNA ligase [Candidatus Nanosynbacter sp. TM7-008]
MLVDRQTARGSVKLSVKWYNLGNNVNRHVANMEKGFLMSQAKMEDIISLCKRRGFIYQGSDVYGGLSGTWDYGPLGVQLKRNIMNLWWRMFVDERDDIYGVDAAILMNQKVWKASGHVDTFVDPLCEDVVNHRRYRTDHILKDNGVDADGLTMEQMDELIAEKGIKSPDGNPLSKSRTFNMMFKTFVGPSGGDSIEIGKDVEGAIVPKGKTIYALQYNPTSISYLRPETAQGIFTNFKNVVDSFYPNLPFGIAQQGKAFRNEIAPRDFVFRSREFEQMEIEYFVSPENWQEAFDELLKATHEFLEALGLNPDNIHELDVPAEDRAHYSKKTIDIEYDFPIGKEELMGIAYRTNFDLNNIQDASGKSMEYTIKGTNKKFVPHVIEPSFGVERALMAVLSSAYREDEQNGSKRVYLALPEHLAPVKFAVSPLLKNKPELVEKAREIYADLSKKNPGRVMWDDNGNIGKRYRRQDEIGTPHCVVVDFQTLEDDTVTVRERDTTEQRRVKVEEL